jgi:hypothetical protein
MHLKIHVLKLLKILAYLIFWYICVPTVVLVFVFLVWMTVDHIKNSGPKLISHWVYISSTGDITKGASYVEYAGGVNSFSGEPPEQDGLVIKEPSYENGNCSRTYRLKDENLYFYAKNEDLTDPYQISYSIKDHVIATGSADELQHSQEGKLTGDAAKNKFDGWRKKFRRELNITDDKLEYCKYWFPVFHERPKIFH